MLRNFNTPGSKMTQEADTRFRREAQLGSHDYDLACKVIDAARVCHVGFSLEGQPYVVPMACARLDNELLLHGSVASRLVKTLSAGLPCCVTVTHFDGLVYARSSFHSSMNYRSTMVFGTARAVLDEDEKRRRLHALVDHLMPGRRAELRSSTRKELNATTLLSLPIEVFSTKCRSGPPEDPKGDLSQPVWAGVVPLALVPGEPQDAPDLLPGIERPDYL
jgi:hypothetical protein